MQEETIVQIYEEDHGCEGIQPGEIPMDEVLLRDDAGAERWVKLPDLAGALPERGRPHCSGKAAAGSAETLSASEIIRTCLQRKSSVKNRPAKAKQGGFIFGGKLCRLSLHDCVSVDEHQPRVTEKIQRVAVVQLEVGIHTGSNAAHPIGNAENLSSAGSDGTKRILTGHTALDGERSSGGKVLDRDDRMVSAQGDLHAVFL